MGEPWKASLTALLLFNLGVFICETEIVILSMRLQHHVTVHYSEPREGRRGKAASGAAPLSSPVLTIVTL